MIKYNLICAKGHEFESWFASSSAYDEQAGRELVECPACGTRQVDKALMMPGVPRRANSRTGDVETLHAGPDEKAKALVEAVRKLRAHVEQNADYVGKQFAEEARSIHYGEREARGIYGEATVDEAKELHEEGIDVAPLPRLPEERN